jgi:dTDP-4-dehydrorhamnose reductase
MKVLVTGSAGMLGRAVVQTVGVSHAVVGVDLPDGDLTSTTDVATLFAAHAPDWVIHTAAYTDVDGAESDAERAAAVNVDGTANLANACDATGAGLTYVSTDYVFDGESRDGYLETSPRNPLSVYGRTKADGEAAVEAMTAPWQIVRTSWLFGPGPRNFVLTIRRLLGERETLSVVTDQTGSPTYAPDLAQVLDRLLVDRPTGVFHATNAGVCSWFDFAREIARRLGADPDRIGPCPSTAFPTAATRPACSILRSRNLEIADCPPRPSWQDALGRYIAWLDRHESNDQGE